VCWRSAPQSPSRSSIFGTVGRSAAYFAWRLHSRSPSLPAPLFRRGDRPQRYAVMPRVRLLPIHRWLVSDGRRAVGVSLRGLDRRADAIATISSVTSSVSQSVARSVSSGVACGCRRER
jgi:hypothetical protein